MSQFAATEKKILLDLVDAAIQYGFDHNTQLPINLTAYPEKFRAPGASFVTLMLHDNLRGCIGSLEAYQPLVVDVAQNAFSAAFSDPRFYPLQKKEFAQITKHISILSSPKPMHFESEADLLRQLRPNIDGLILSDHEHRGTFLPSVWESLPTPELFWQHLKLKAGLPESYWSDTLTVERYTTEMI